MMRLKIPMVMTMNDGDDSVCFRVWFVLFCFVWFPLRVQEAIMLVFMHGAWGFPYTP